MKLNHQQKLILYGLGLAVLVVIWYLGFYNANNKKIAGIKAEIAKINDDLVKAKSASSGMKTHKDEIEKIKEEIEGMKEKIPSKDQLLYLSNLIQRRGEQYGLKFENITPRKEVLFTGTQGDGSIIKVPINIWITGKYFDLAKFLESFDSFPFLLKGGSLTISGDDENYPNLDIYLIVYTYLYNQD